METIKLGSKGKDVAFAKENLARNGYQVDQSDLFDENMKIAVIDFRKYSANYRY